MGRNAQIDADRRAAARAAILDGALELFSRQGVQSVTTADVAAAAGVSKGLVFAYFDSKEDLITAALAEQIYEGEGIVAEALATPTPHEALAALITAQLGYVDEHRDHARWLMTAALDPFLQPLYAAASMKTATQRASLAASLGSLFLALDLDEPAQAMTDFLSDLTGAIQVRLTSPNPPPAHRVRDRLLATYSKGKRYAPPTPPPLRGAGAEPRRLRIGRRRRRGGAVRQRGAGIAVGRGHASRDPAGPRREQADARRALPAGVGSDGSGR